jgi:transposase InsO family protein
MGLRRLVVEVDPSTLNVTEFCRSHGISTWFFWDLRRRHAREGDAALVPRSRAPKTVANRTPAAVEDAIVAKRKQLTDAGLDAGPATIAWHLRDLDGVPSESTIWRILKTRGFVTAEPAKAPKRAARSFTAERANDCWQLDDTTWALADDQEVKILNIIDDHSRLVVASVAMPSATGAATLQALAEAAAVLGWPARFLSDNARAFRHVLADALAPMGITAGHSRPYHPQTNGKVERFHQTLKRWLRAQPPPATLAELQWLLDCFRPLYNHDRPHRALQRRVPAQAWTDAPKNGPSGQPLGTPTQTHTVKVLGSRVRLGRYLVALDKTHNDRHALAVITGTACHIFIDGHLARALTINPTKTYQPIHDRPGRPPRLP